MGDKEALTEADIDAMSPGKVYRTLSDFGVNGDDLSPPEAKSALKQKIRELTEEADKARSPEQVAEMMASVAESYRSKRELLLQRCQDVIAFLPTLDQSDREKLTLRFRRDVMEVLGEVQEHLSKDDCPILVAGETSAGKSTLLNLLLGDDILPVAHLSSTSTICEVKYGETRQAVVHLREPDPETESHQVTLTLSADSEVCRQQLEPNIHLKTTERETLPPATKIEIFWPLAFLKGGVTIVDSPGVGESEMMDDVIARYIPSAFAFIYIIDSSRAGGVQQDRLGRLLLKCKDQGARSELEQFDPTKAIFICNKWDLVPEGERHGVREETIRKLKEMWRGLDESQVFTHSNTEAEKSGFRSADFTKLLDGIYELLPQSLHHKLAVQYRRMVGLLEEALTYVRLKLNDAFRNLDKDERHGAYARAQTALSQFDESTARDIKELKDLLEDAKEAAVTIMTEISNLEGDESKQHLTGIQTKAGTDKYAVQNITLETIHCLLRKEPLKDYVTVANEQFKAKIRDIVTKVEQCHETDIGPVTGQRCRLDRVNYLLLSFLDKILHWSRTIPVTSGGILLLLPLFIPVWVLLESSNRSSISELAIASITTEEMFKAIAEYSLQSSFNLLNEFESELQAVKNVDKRLVEERFAETRSQMDLVSTYEPQASGITLQLGRLAMVELTELREYEFDLDSIIGWPDPQNRIGGGSYGEVYRVQVQCRGGESVRAALKVGVYPYDLTTEENAWVFLIEENNLRKLRGEHIVEYFGTAWKKEEGGLRLGLVMELCGGTLESRVIGNREHNPTWWGHDPVMKQRAFRYIQDKVIQLCEGLRTIHDAGYIHRDLKLINVLVTPGDVVKLTDFGETKREDNVTGTMTGTATYAAPEVMERKVYDKSADIYSLGLILWEMWYGRSVWDALQDGSLRSPTEGVPMMMPHSPDSIRPIPEWITLVRDCVNRDARRRPTALECLQRIRSMTMEEWGSIFSRVTSLQP
ncbi:dual serine/threonine and tyrosine protein kinase-like [Branchiostoma floridae x Branchiostoma japonicum]